MKQYKFDRNYLNLLIKNKDKLLDNDLVILVTYIEVLQDKLKTYKNMRKELIKEFNFYETTEWGIKGYEILEKFRNILNKVGGSDE